MLGREVFDSQVFGLSLWSVVPSTTIDSNHKEVSVILIPCFRYHTPNIAMAFFDVHHLGTMNMLSHTLPSSTCTISVGDR